MFCKPNNALPRFPLQEAKNKEFSCNLIGSVAISQSKPRWLRNSAAPGTPLTGPKFSCSVWMQDLGTAEGLIIAYGEGKATAISLLLLK